jgi:CUB domain
LGFFASAALVVGHISLIQHALYKLEKSNVSDVCIGNRCSSSADPEPITSNSTMSSLTSPNYPYLYPNNANCRWRITADAGNGVSELSSLLIYSLHSVSNILAISIVKEPPCRMYFITANKGFRSYYKFSVVWHVEPYEVDVYAVFGCY